MTKSTIAQTWITGLIVFAGGLLVGGLGIALMLALGSQYTPAPMLHGWQAGSDSDEPWMCALYGAASAAVAFLLLMRFFTFAPKPARQMS